ncbi:MAG TPA: UDP-2,3-diacylglucosamine diphosphatase LpxI [Bacillota bacterium]
MVKVKRIGLVAGRGNLPFDVLTEIQRRGAEPVVVGLKGEVDPKLEKQVNHYCQLAPGQMGEIIATFKSYTVDELVFAGKVGKEALFKGGWDQLVQRMLSALPQKNDDAILLAIVEEFERNGIKVAKQTEYLKEHLAPAGPLCGELTLAELADVQFGFRMAKGSGQLDFGQSVVVKQGVVLAVEAIEGTDQAILRGGTLGGPGTVVVKVSKPQQDERFDVPTVGPTTLESMITAKAAVLAVEAGKTLITEKAEFLRLALENRIKVIAVTG